MPIIRETPDSAKFNRGTELFGAYGHLLEN